MAENYYDLSTGIQAAKDAQRIAEKANIEVLVVTEKTRSQRDDDLIFWQSVGQLFIPGLFLAVIVYLPVTTFRQRKPASQ